MEPATIMAIGSLAAAVIGAIANRANQESSEDFTKSENELAYQRSLPTAQIQNLKDAGLNPNLYYSSIQPASYTPTQGQRTNYQAPDIAKAISMGWNREEQEQRMDIQKEELRTRQLNNDYLEISLADRLQALGLGNQQKVMDLANKQLDLKLKDAKTKLTNKQYDALVQNMDKVSKEIENLVKLGKIRDLETAEKELTLQLNKELKPHGMTISDPLWARFLILRWNDLKQWLDGPKGTQLYKDIPFEPLTHPLEQLRHDKFYITRPTTNFSPHLRR